MSILICHRDAEVVSECVRINIFPSSHNQAERRAVVRGISDALRKALYGQLLTGGNRYTFQVVRRSTISLG